MTTEEYIIFIICKHFKKTNDVYATINEYSSKLSHLLHEIEKEALENRLIESPDYIELTIKKACVLWQTTKEMVLKKTRIRNIVDIRQAIIIVSFENFDITKSDIAKKFNLNHATIIHSLKQKDTLMMDYDWRLRYEELTKYAKSINN